MYEFETYLCILHDEFEIKLISHILNNHINSHSDQEGIMEA